MSYYDTIKRYSGEEVSALIARATDAEVTRAIRSQGEDTGELAALLSLKAVGRLEEMALRSREITLGNFGRTIQLYTPLYIANFCDNHCLYCGFKHENKFERKRLTIDELRREAEHIRSTGLGHILVLTGDSRRESPVSYVKECVEALGEYFSSISVEIYALTEDEYRKLVEAGVDGLTIYQETYDQDVYKVMHPAGPKRDYLFRLDAPERGARAGMRNINIGALLGLADWRREAFYMALHAKYILDNYPFVEVGVAIPRLRPYAGDFKPAYEVSDRDVVQLITALRIFMPRLGITVSTREGAAFRENIISLGVTRMSAGSSTSVGGHTLAAGEEDTPQFEISDERDVDQIKASLAARGYQPVLKDWMRI